MARRPRACSPRGSLAASATRPIWRRPGWRLNAACFPPMRQDRIWSPGPDGPPAARRAGRHPAARPQEHHLVSFAPTGSVSIAFFDNCSTGIEPAHAWQYRRRLRIGEAPARNVVAQNPAWRLWRRLHGDGDELPPYFRRAADIAPSAHIAMLAALQPWVDAAISKSAAAARVHGGRGRRAVPASLAPGSERSDGVPAGSPDAGGAGAGPARRADRPGGSRGRLRGCRVTRWRAALRRQRAEASATVRGWPAPRKTAAAAGAGWLSAGHRRPCAAIAGPLCRLVDPPACRSTG